MNILWIFKRTLITFLKAGLPSNNALTKFSFKRFLLLIFLLPIFLLSQLINWVCFKIDEVFFKDYQKTKIQNPIFIIGPTRSASTYFYHLLASDSQRFTTFHLWEILLAPSIVQKLFWIKLANLDKQIGGFGKKSIVYFDKKWLSGINKMHKTSLFLPEEDALLFIHHFASLYLALIFPLDDKLLSYGQFDETINQEEKNQIMRFYKKCLQKHLYVFGKGRQLLSKNPLFSAKTFTITQWFPSCKLLYMLRSPMQVVPSSLSFFHYLISRFSLIKSKKEIYPRISNFLQYWYFHTFAHLEKAPDTPLVLVNFNELTQHPRVCIQQIYHQLNYPLDASFTTVLIQEQQNAQRFKSKHQYCLADYGLDEAILQKDFQGVYPKVLS